MRVMSKVRVMRGSAEATAQDSTGDASPPDDALMNEMAGLDENDPRALGRFMRKMAAESGEDLGPEFNEVIGRLEKGEDPDKIEQDMGDIFGDEAAGGLSGMDDMGFGGGGGGGGKSPENPSTRADAAAEAKDKKAIAKRRTVAMPRKAKSAKASASKKKRS